MYLYFTIFSLIFVILMWGLYVYKLRFDVKDQHSGKGKISDLLFLLGLALVVKCFWSVLVNGYEADITCFKAWSQWVFDYGVGKFYYLDGFTDYPPGYMYVLYVIAAIRKLFGVALDSRVSIFLLKLFPILCDLVAGGLIYKISEKKWNHRKAIWFVALYVFNPAVVLNSSIWGQVDSVFVLCVFATCYFCMVEKRWVAYFLFALGVLVKPQSLIFAPVLIFTFIDQVILHDFSWKKCIKDVLLGVVAIAAFVLAAAPFGLEKVFPQYVETISSYPYASVNAYNFWTVLGKNWMPQSDQFLFLTCKQWGTFGIIAAIILGAWSFFKLKDSKEKYFLSPAIIISTLFVFSVRMHERYLFPVVVLLLAVYLLKPSKENFVSFVGISVLHFMNVVDVFYKSFHKEINGQYSIFSSLVALCTVLVYLYFIYHCFHTEKENKKSIWKFAWQKDLVVFGAILAVYCAFAFYDLGNRKAPETEWKTSLNNKQTITLDLGEEKSISNLYVYLGNFEERRFTLQLGNDSKLEKWNAVGEVTFNSVFQWNKGNFLIDTETGETIKVMDTSKKYRYIRLCPEDAEARIKEMVILDTWGKQVRPVNASEYKPLFDEQKLFPKEITFREGTYFDEIYHARTAYEMVNGEYCYENTHPPLGKEIMSIGVRIFGMNPFGWRIMGTLFGIFMLPFLFLFAKKLFKETWVAGIVTFLFAFDFMHFSQTRIATIDVYVTFFVLVMYYFMYCYIQKDFFDGPVYKNWLPLGLCGISMGLGFASKWTAIYAGCGLGLIFIATMCCRAREYFAAKKTKKGFGRVKDFPRRFWLTVLFCFGFFVIIPAGIYTLSYLGFSDGTKDNFIIQMLNNQRSMFDYHSQLVATHPYSSWWYEWPVMTRPVFYYCHTLASGLREGISAFGNPLVWWVSVPSAIYMIYRAIRHKDTKALFILVGYLAQYVPWMLVPRITFAYHYFPSTVFAVLMIGYTMYCIVNQKKNRIKYMILYAMAAGLLFLMFYPILSGQPVSFEYVEHSLRWFKGWVFAL